MKARPSRGSNRPRKAANPTEAIRRRIAAAPKGQIFTPADFATMGSRAAIDQALSRLTVAGELRRLARGLYDRPRSHAVLGALLPSADAIASALAGKGHLRLQPSGAYAANLLGLTEQVPMRLVFLTDGASRTVQVGAQQVVLRHTTPRNMATSGRVSGLVIQALRHLKARNVDARVLRQLRKRVTSTERKILLADAHLAPAWIARIMESIAREAA